MVKAGPDFGRDRGWRVGLALLVAVLAMSSTPGAMATERSARGAADASRILATGDSMMRYLDRRLKYELGRNPEVALRSDVRIGSGISKENWVGIARRQVLRHTPRATVVFMGAAEGFDMPRAPCCDGAWVAEYARRVKRMIRSYSRQGRGEVYWLTLPAPRPARRARIFMQVNRAIRRAVRSSGPRAHLVDAWARLTPHGRYRRTMRFKGRRVVVRTKDGVHLSSGGHAVTAPLVVEAMRKDGLIIEEAVPR